jgi:hypothetical protein
MEPYGNAQTPGNQGPASGGLAPTWQAGQASAGAHPAAGWQNGQIPSSPAYSGVLAPNSFGATVIGKTAKWTALPIIALWFKILAWVSLVGGALGFLIALIVGFASASNPYVGGAAAGLGFVYGIFLLLGGAYGFLWNLFFSEMIGVFLAIEKNTRKE